MNWHLARAVFDIALIVLLGVLLVVAAWNEQWTQAIFWYLLLVFPRRQDR